MPLIEVEDLQIDFVTKRGVIKAVDGVDFQIEERKTLGIVGESGCGKSVTALSIIGLLDIPPAKVVKGKILFKSKNKIIDINKLNHKGSKIRSIRGNEISMIFQEPMTSLNPVLTIGDQITESIITHQNVAYKEAKTKSIDMLNSVGISNPSQRLNEYPHQLSGGMRQRCMIAIALSCTPKLLIADEPTTALDVTIQAQVLELIDQLKHEFNTAMLFISHDLGVIFSEADNVAVMYLGKIVESGTVEQIFENHKHPYTEGLFNSIPTITTDKSQRLVPIQGVVPDMFDLPKGCGFQNRCPKKFDLCKHKNPILKEISNGHKVSCWLYE